MAKDNEKLQVFLGNLDEYEKQIEIEEEARQRYEQARADEERGFAKHTQVLQLQQDWLDAAKKRIELDQRRREGPRPKARAKRRK